MAVIVFAIAMISGRGIHALEFAWGALGTAGALNVYSNRRASSGLMDAAFLEGKIEKAKFSVVEATKASSALSRSKTKGN